VPVSRAAGGPARVVESLPARPLEALPANVELVSAGSATHDALAGLVLAALAGCGLLLLALALVPEQALRPAALYYALAPRRMDLGALGVGIVILVGTLFAIR
jgi:hypothetical protein